MLKLLKDEKLLDPLREFAAAHPVFGTCAGAILMAARVTNPAQESLELIDMEVERNAYGRQVHSHIARLEGFPGGPFEAVFIRAPIIRQTGPQVRVLARYQGRPVLVEQERHLAATFHPELTGDARIHRLFLEKIAR